MFKLGENLCLLREKVTLKLERNYVNIGNDPSLFLIFAYTLPTVSVLACGAADGDASMRQNE